MGEGGDKTEWLELRSLPWDSRTRLSLGGGRVRLRGLPGPPAFSTYHLQALLGLAVWAPQYLLTAAAAAPAASAQPILSAAAPPWLPLSPLVPHQRTGHPLCLASRLPSTTCSGQDTLQPGEVVPHPLQHPAWIGWGVFLHLPGEAEPSIQDTAPMQGSPGGPVTQPGLQTALPQPKSSGSRAWVVSTHPPQWQEEDGTLIPNSQPLSTPHSPPASLRMSPWIPEGYGRSQRLGPP